MAKFFKLQRRRLKIIRGDTLREPAQSGSAHGVIGEDITQRIDDLNRSGVMVGDQFAQPRESLIQIEHLNVRGRTRSGILLRYNALGGFVGLY